MIYSVGENLFDRNSGIEFAQIQRTQALNSAHIQAKIVTRKYNRRLSLITEENNISDVQINMFDFFQKATNLQANHQTTRDLKSLARERYNLKYNEKFFEINKSGRTYAQIYAMGGTEKYVDKVVYLDRFNNKTLTHYYDWRGFLSMTENYDNANNLISQNYLDVDGNTVLEVFYTNVYGTIEPTMWKLINYKGFDYLFDYEEQLFLFFLNELNREEPSVFIADCPEVVVSIMSIDNPLKTIGYVHQNHRNYAGNVISEYTKIIQPEFGQLDLIAVATQKQANDLASIAKSPVVVLPTTTFATINKTSEITTLRKVVYVGRLTRHKNVDELIDLFEYIHKRDANVKFVIKGYFESKEYEEAFNQRLAKCKLTEVVEHLQYSPDNSELFEDASVFVSTSMSEGFGMNALESMAHGIPVACYGVPYIKDNLVKDGVNGIVTIKHTPQELGRKILSTFKKPQTVAQLQQGALATAEEFSAEQLVKNFDKLLDLGYASMAEKRVDLSFVVPVYNVVKYLEATLDSIFNQKTKYDYEVICVDDGSTDSSAEILKQYAEKYSNLKFISQKNCGVGAARNLGLSHVEGEYVAFIDSDDLLADNYVETVMYNFKRTYADIVTYAARKIKEDGTNFTDQVDIFGAPNKIYASGIEQFNTMNIYRYYMVAVWKYVTKTAHLREYKITFPNTQLSEDDYFSFFNYQLAKRTVSIKDVLYNYRIHDKSLIRTFTQADKSTDKRVEHYKAFELLLKQITVEKIKITPSITRYLMNDFLTKLIFKDELNTNIEHTTMVMVGKYLSKEIVTELQAMLREQYKVYVRKATVLN